MSKKCNKCGNYVDDTALFCTQCGNKIPIVSDETLKIERVTFEKEQEELNKRLAKINNNKTTSTNIPNTNYNNRNIPNIANYDNVNIPLNKNITKNNYNMQYKMPKTAINNYNQCTTFNNTNSILSIEKIDNKCYIKLPLNLTIILGICIVVLLLIIIVLILL